MKPPIAFAVALLVPVTVAIGIASFQLPDADGLHSALEAVYVAALLLPAIVVTLWRPPGQRFNDLLSVPLAASAGLCLAAASSYLLGSGPVARYEPTISDELLPRVDKLWVHAAVELLMSFLVVAAALVVLAVIAGHIRRRRSS